VFLPWASIRIFIASVDVNGVDTGDGKLALVVFLAAGVVVFIGKTSRMLKAGAVASSVAAVVCVYEVGNIDSVTSSPVAQVSVGIGLYLGVLGSLASVGGLGMLLWSMRNTKPVPTQGDS
jgi:hypothetical protein